MDAGSSSWQEPQHRARNWAVATLSSILASGIFDQPKDIYGKICPGHNQKLLPKSLLFLEDCVLLHIFMTTEFCSLIFKQFLLLLLLNRRRTGEDAAEKAKKQSLPKRAKKALRSGSPCISFNPNMCQFCSSLNTHLCQALYSLRFCVALHAICHSQQEGHIEGFTCERFCLPPPPLCVCVIYFQRTATNSS